MMFKKGSKVEVWNTREVSSGSWWSAEIVSCNGHSYYVRYYGYSSVIVDRVPRKAIRPCPPPDGGLKDLMSGDVVEVFDNNSWKLAEVLMVVDKNNCYVRLLGSSREFRAHKSHVRIRLSWQGNKWVVIHKDSGKQNRGMPSSPSMGGKFGYRMPQLCVEMDLSAGKNIFPIENDDFSEKTSWLFPRSTKKRPLGIPVEARNAGRRKKRQIENDGRHQGIIAECPVEMYNAGRRNKRAIEKDGRCQGIIAERPILCLEKVDAVAFPGRVLGEKCMNSSLNSRTTGSYKMELGRGISSSDRQKCLLRSSEPSDAESTSSSVGSCSVSSSPCRSQQHHVTSPYQQLHSHSDHAETSCGLETESSLPRKEELQADIHQLELNAYRSTLIALYASGPISWEREALITNLRLMLNISNDEHLMELRNLLHSEIATTTS